jgi:hypothetical protein
LPTLFGCRKSRLFGRDDNRKTAWMQVSAAHALCAKRLPCAAKANLQKHPF